MFLAVPQKLTRQMASANPWVSKNQSPARRKTRPFQPIPRNLRLISQL
jgi:transposase